MEYFIMIASIALAHAATSLPACCIPSSVDCELAEALYCTYQQGGPPERAGLDWRGQPCPTWADLLRRAEAGDESAIGVVAKWREVASSQGDRVAYYQDSIQLPCWGELQLAGNSRWHALIRPTRIPGIVEVIEPAVEGDGWHLPLEAARHLRPLKGGLFYGFTVLTQAQVVAERRKQRSKRPQAERIAATRAEMEKIVPGVHALHTETWDGTVEMKLVVKVDPPTISTTHWRIRFADGSTLSCLYDPITVVEAPPELLAMVEVQAATSATTQAGHVEGVEPTEDATSEDGDVWGEQ